MINNGSEENDEHDDDNDEDDDIEMVDPDLRRDTAFQSRSNRYAQQYRPVDELWCNQPTLACVLRFPAQANPITPCCPRQCSCNASAAAAPDDSCQQHLTSYALLLSGGTTFERNERLRHASR